MEDKNTKKQKIVDATMRILSVTPIEDVTMRMIASEAGVTTGSIYHHYHNKEDLFYSVMRQSLHFTTKLYQTIKTEGNLKEGKELLEEIKTEVANRISKEDQQKLHIQFISEMVKKDSMIAGKYRENYKDLLDSTANLLLKAFQVEDNVNKRDLATILVAAIDGIAIQQMLDVLPKDMDKMIDTFVSFFTEGLENYLNSHKKK